MAPVILTSADSSAACLELMGGNDARAQSLVVDGLELFLIVRPVSQRGGGDLYCVHSCEGRVFTKVMLLDITGHGDQAAAIAQQVHPLLHMFAMDTDPGQIMDSVNRQYRRFVPSPVLAMSLCAIHDSRHGRFRYVNAGQPRPLYWNADTRCWTTVTPSRPSAGGLPFGVLPDARYEEETIVFGPGNMMLFFSDGVPEVWTETGEMLGAEGVQRLVQETTEQIEAGFALSDLADKFLSRLAAINGGPEFQDDVTLLWFRRSLDSF